MNAVFLVALCFSILVEAMKRLVEPESLKNPDLILIVGGIGLLINVIGMFLFHGKCLEFNIKSIRVFSLFQVVGGLKWIGLLQ